ncbi:SpoIIE family protein phosphatase [Kitasatospora sp. NPDC006697]|uniref:SpoIIE family protein phosphatase n=1 Tax=Kitasatospora sp. NPDC006697 TaxID=3364020 RepID=UPI0036CDBA7D
MPSQHGLPLELPVTDPFRSGGPVGAVAVLDSAGLVSGWSPAAGELLGFGPSEVLGRPATDLLADPRDAARAGAAARRCRSGRNWSGMLTLRHRDGHRIDVGLRLTAPFRIDGRIRILAVAVDLADQPSWAVSGPVLEAFLTRSPVGMAILGPDLRYAWINDTLERLGGVPRAQRIGRRMRDSMPGLDTDALEDQMRAVLATGEPVIDYEYQGWTDAHPGQQRSYSTSFFRLTDGDGNVLGVCYMGMDVTDRWRARERLALVTRAGTAIGTTLDVSRTAQELADLAVPLFADFAAVDLLDSVLRGDEPAPAAVSAHPSMTRAGLASVRAGVPEALAAAGEPVNVIPPNQDGRYLIHGEPLLIPELDPIDNAWTVEQPATAAKIREYGLHSLIAVPLRARGVVLGLATFIRSADPTAFEPDDLLLAEELATRAAVCVDNARRYTREHAASLSLQHSLLPTSLASGSALRVASRYLPAAQDGVGGDWFDAIPLSGARMALVVGDVAGHGITAVATMGRLRAAVHTLADMDLPPEEVLAHLDDLVIRLSDEEPSAAAAVLGATCLYAVYDPVSARCTMARAGHPLPALVTPEGTVTFPDLPAGPPLGLGSLPFESAEFELPEASVIALYTNGLLSSFDQDIDIGLDLLSRALALPGLTPEEQCDAVVAGLPPGPPADDIALLLARTRVLTGDQVAAWDITPDPAQVAVARRLATAQLEQWGLAELATTTELIVSELVTNAIRYAPGPVRLRLIRHSVLICEVCDSGSTAPHLRHARTTDEGGRGLFLVALLTRRWGTRFTPAGKLIWTEQALPAGEDG